MDHTKTTPLVSVLMPVYNGEKYIEASIKSVLDQSFTDFELLVLNDGSTDASESVVQSFKDERIRLINNEKNIKLIATLNRGLKEARGKWIARQDCDDMSLPHRLERQLAYLESHPKTRLLGTKVRIVDNSGNTISETKRPGTHYQNKWSLLFATTFMHSSVMFCAKTVRDLGGYATTYLHAEDFELWSRLVNSHEVSQMDETLVCLRKHEESIGAQHNTDQQYRNIDISKRNISWLSIKGFDNQRVTSMLEWYRKMGKEQLEKKAIYKTFVQLYAGFLKNNPSMSATDKHWIAKDLQMKCSSLLFGGSLVSQINLLAWGLFVSMYGGKYHFHKALLKKYINSLLGKFVLILVTNYF